MKNNEAIFWLVAVAAAALYGLMEGARYWGWVQTTPPLVSRLVLHAVLETYGWLPSFLAGLIVRRRALLLALVTVLLGSFLAAGFRGYFTPQLVIDDWDPGIVNLTQSVLAILGAAVSARAGQFLAARRSSNRPLQPTAREDARSG